MISIHSSKAEIMESRGGAQQSVARTMDEGAVVAAKPSRVRSTSLRYCGTVHATEMQTVRLVRDA